MHDDLKGGMLKLSQKKIHFLIFYPVFEIDEDFDEESAVHDVVYNMLERDVVDINSLNNELIMKNKTKKFKDPTPKMKLRHEQVKKCTKYFRKSFKERGDL